MKSCMNCDNTIVSTGANGAIDFSARVCIEGPPSCFPIPVGPGQMTIAASYPTVNATTIPCKRHAPKPGAEAEENKPS